MAPATVLSRETTIARVPPVVDFFEVGYRFGAYVTRRSCRSAGVISFTGQDLGHASCNMPWDPDAAVDHLWKFSTNSTRLACAKYTADAVDAGLNAHIGRTKYAKDFGPMLLQAGFRTMPPGTAAQSGDIIIFPGFKKDISKNVKKDHAAGHMEMFDGKHKIWISDFKQHGDVYPGKDYRNANVHYTLYRYGQ